MKKNILFGPIILSFVLEGCKQDVKEEKEASTEVTKELSVGQEEVTETPEHTGDLQLRIKTKKRISSPCLVCLGGF